MRVLVTADYRMISQQAANIVCAALRARPEVTLGLPTGNTPLGMYEELVRLHETEGLDFSKARTFNLDEYIGLAAGHSASYHAYMRRHFFDRVNVVAENTDIPRGARGIDVDAESKRYESAITAAGGIDLLIVGIGANGHIAFNEPGSSFASRTRVVELAPETIANARRYFKSDADVPRTAITVGIGTLLEARRILLLASGTSKADIVRRCLHGPVSESLPATALQLHPNVTAILDEAAAPPDIAG
jgi:glucosamine-6-phosphate deaminase